MPTAGRPIRETGYTYAIIALTLIFLAFGIVHNQNKSEKTGLLLFNLPKGSKVVNETTGKQLGVFLGDKGVKRPGSKDTTFAARLPFGTYRFVVEELSGERHVVEIEVKKKVEVFHLIGGEVRRLR
jgi:hypothetical protein